MLLQGRELFPDEIIFEDFFHLYAAGAALLCIPYRSDDGWRCP